MSNRMSGLILKEDKDLLALIKYIAPEDKLEKY